MSYEGYSNVYCLKGHYLESFAAHDYMWDDPSSIVCPVCGPLGSKEWIEDCIDQTNGCECEYMKEGEKCGAHPSVETVIAFDPVPCKGCKGSGNTLLAVSYIEIPCVCKGKNHACEKCHGTAIKRVVDKEMEVECPLCSGSGLQYVEVFDLSPLYCKWPNKEVPLRLDGFSYKKLNVD